jgi:BolA protein
MQTVKTGTAMSVAASIEQKLTEAFSPTLLEVIDESHHHAGHAGNPGGGESHFRIRIQAEAFAGKPRVAQQREIYKVLAEELAGPVHALALEVSS